MSTMNALMVRKSEYSLEEVLSKVILNKKKTDPYTKIDFDGDMMKMASERYKCFVNSGTKCVSCGIKGQYFVKERFIADKVYHFNLYAIDENDEEVLLTKDHIVPKSKGGADDISNYQTMCTECNLRKGDNINKNIILYSVDKNCEGVN